MYIYCYIAKVGHKIAMGVAFKGNKVLRSGQQIFLLKLYPYGNASKVVVLMEKSCTKTFDKRRDFSLCMKVLDQNQILRIRSGKLRIENENVKSKFIFDEGDGKSKPVQKR